MNVEESDTDLGRWRMASRSAAPPLRAHVRGYFGSESFVPAALRERHLPTPGAALVINFADPHRLIERETGEMGWGHRAWIVGLQTGPRLSEAVGAREFLAVSLTPTGAWRLLRTPMETITDRIVDLEDIDRSFARRLLSAVDAPRDWSARFEALDRVFIDRICDDGGAEPVTPRVLAKLSAGPGDIGQIAADFGRSHRWLIARFRDEVGLTPKSTARLLRFNRAVAAINGRRPRPDGKPYLEGVAQADSVETPDWSDLAIDCGYYDQAHFINEFRAYTGSSPGAFLREVGMAAV